MKKNAIVAIIPARANSKRLPGKNIKKLGNKPLIAYTISAALNSRSVKRVIVSTDSKKIASIGQKFGAEIPFLRPKDLATDTSKTVDVLTHLIKKIEITSSRPDIVILLQPTSPFTMAQDIELAISTLKKTKTNSCVSMCEIKEHPEWMFKHYKNRAYPFIKSNKLQKRSQELTKLYTLNGAVYAIRTDFLMREKKIIDPKSLSFILMPHERSIDIDTRYDFAIAQTMIKLQSHEL